MSDSIQALENDQRQMRRNVFVQQVLHVLQGTVQIRAAHPDIPVSDHYIEFTDSSAYVIAPLVEAVEILEAIIWASDGCVGHRNCAHLLEPWQRARALLQNKWDAYERCATWPNTSE